MSDNPLHNKPKNNTAILFATHVLDSYTIKAFEDLYDDCKDDFSVVLSCYQDVLEQNKAVWDKYPCHIRDLNSIDKNGYRMSAEFESSKVIAPKGWFNPEFFLLDYYLKNPGYDFYWLIEYDVRFSGNWCLFFNAFVDNKTDLLGTGFVRGDKDRFFYDWKNINLNIGKEKQMKVFFPVIRVSGKGLAFLDEQYKKGARGFCEVLVPTLLNLNGFTLEDIGEQWYNPRGGFHYATLVLKNRKTRWPISIRTKKFPQPDHLYHPVKKIGLKTYLFLCLMDVVYFLHINKQFWPCFLFFRKIFSRKQDGVARPFR